MPWVSLRHKSWEASKKATRQGPLNCLWDVLLDGTQEERTSFRVSRGCCVRSMSWDAYLSQAVKHLWHHGQVLEETRQEQTGQTWRELSVFQPSPPEIQHSGPHVWLETLFRGPALGLHLMAVQKLRREGQRETRLAGREKEPKEVWKTTRREWKNGHGVKTAVTKISLCRVSLLVWNVKSPQSEFPAGAVSIKRLCVSNHRLFLVVGILVVVVSASLKFCTAKPPECDLPCCLQPWRSTKMISVLWDDNQGPVGTWCALYVTVSSRRQREARPRTHVSQHHSPPWRGRTMMGMIL